MKADLETNMEALVQEINFLKGLYEEVAAAALSIGGRPRGQFCEGDGVGKLQRSGYISGQAD